MERLMGEEAAADGAFALSAMTLLKKIQDNEGKKVATILEPEILPTEELKKLHDFAKGFDDGFLYRITDLPPSILQTSLQAVANRFKCDVSDWSTLQRATRLKFCLNCGIRNFVLQNIERYPKSSFSRKQSFERSAGFRKLAISCDSDFARCIETPECSKLDLQTLDLIRQDPDTGKLVGGAYIGRRESVMVSPCCGFVVSVSSIRFNAQTWDCPACAATKKAAQEELLDPRVCAHCGKRSQLKLAMSHIVMLRDGKGRVKAHGFCKGHFRSWARCESGYLDFEFVSLNMTNRSGNGLVLNPK
jgi:hypothetical protein